MPDESSKKKGTAEKGRKRTREGSSQTDEKTRPTNITSMDARSASRLQTRGSPVLKRNSTRY